MSTPDPRRRSPAFPRNRDPILDALREVLPAPSTRPDGPRVSVLELASGPGEHAVYFARRLGHVVWQPSDQSPAALASATAWAADADLPNLAPPVPLDVRTDAPPKPGTWGAVVAINLLHMIDPETVRATLRVAADALAPGGVFAVYDCFTFDGQHVSPSNARFDAYLRQTTPGGRVYAHEEVTAWAAAAGLGAPQVRWLPANNQLACWTRAASSTS